MTTQPITETRFEVTAFSDNDKDQHILNRFNQCLVEYLESIDFDSPGMMELNIKQTGIRQYLNIVEQMMGISFRLSFTQYQIPSGDITSEQSLTEVHLVELSRPFMYAFNPVSDNTKLVLVKNGGVSTVRKVEITSKNEAIRDRLQDLFDHGVISIDIVNDFSTEFILVVTDDWFDRYISLLQYLQYVIFDIHIDLDTPNYRCLEECEMSGIAKGHYLCIDNSENDDARRIVLREK